MQRQNPMKEAKSLLLYRKRTRKKPNMQKIPNILSMNLEQGDQEEKCRIERITVLNQKKGKKEKIGKKGENIKYFQQYIRKDTQRNIKSFNSIHYLAPALNVS